MKTEKLLKLLMVLIIFITISCTNKRILIDDCTQISELLYYESKPFTGTIFDVGGHGYEQEYKNGMKNGFYRSWYNENYLDKVNRKEKQLEAEVHYVGNVRDGARKHWYQSGKIESEEFFSMGQEVGIWREWYETGKLAKERNGEGGIDHYMKRWFENGNLAYDYKYNDDYTIGFELTYYENGQLAKEIHTEAGVNHGNLREFYETGILKYDVLFYYGARLYMKSYNENGTPDIFRFYKNDWECKTEHHYYYNGNHTYEVSDFKEHTTTYYDKNGYIIKCLKMYGYN